MRVTMLGSGTSSGVPRIGGDWGACDPDEPKNRRSRVSILVEHDDVAVLVDTGPDFRAQMLGAHVTRLDAVLFTHDHADHTHGIDDLRQIFHLMRAPVVCYAHPATWRGLRERFRYVFDGRVGYPPIAEARDLPDCLTLGGLAISWFPQIHGHIGSTGLRFENGDKALAYSTDVNELPPEADTMLEGLDVWIVDALRRNSHPTHSHLANTLGWIARYRPRRAVLTHMDQSMDHATLSRELPLGVEPGYDGLVIDLD